MNALQIIQAAADDIGLGAISAAVASTDVKIRQLVGLLNKECRALRRRYPWQAITFEASFVSTGVESQGTIASLVGSGPALLDITRETMWNRTTRQPVLGPFTPQEWSASKAQVISVPQNCYRIRGNQLLFMGTLVAGEDVYFEYTTKDFCTDAAGTTYSDAIADDTDVLLLNDELALLGLIWRWKKAKGFDYGEDMKEYEIQVNDAIAKDATKPRIDLSGGSTDGRGRPTIPRLIGS